MRRNQNILLLGVLFITFCLGLLFPCSTKATTSELNASMQVSPVIERLSLDPGMQVIKAITVTNQSDKTLKVRVYVTPYSISSQNGASDFESQSEYTQIYHWISIKNDNRDYEDTSRFSIEPNTTKIINYRISVPKSAPGESQHACVFIEEISEDEKEPNSITTISRIPVKIFADVSGDTIKDAEIIALDTNTVIIDNKVKATTVVKNIGNIDIKPTLTLKLNSLNGETVFTDTKAAIIFPENESDIKVEWPDTPAFGIYHLIAITNVLGKSSTVEKTILILPSWFIVLSIVVLVLIIVLLIRFKKKRHTTHDEDSALS